MNFIKVNLTRGDVVYVNIAQILDFRNYGDQGGLIRLAISAGEQNTLARLIVKEDAEQIRMLIKNSK